MATTDDSPADAGAPIRILHMMVREEDGQAQTFEVIGDIANDKWLDGLWVAIGRDAPVHMTGTDFFPRVEAARRLEPAEIDRLPLGKACEALRDAACAAQAARDKAAEAVKEKTRVPTPWLARFDFSDHEPLQKAWGAWSSSASASPPPTIDLLAWVTDAGGAVDASVPPARRAVTTDEVVTRPLFELGILFVHGIGPHRVRETLLHFGEPLVDFWLQLMRRHRSMAARALGPVVARSLQDRVMQRVARAREDEDGAKRVVDRLAMAANRKNAGAAAATAPARPDLACAWIRTEDTLLADEGSGAPSATVMRLMRFDREAGLHDSHVLMAEAWWVRDAVPPRRAELLAWLNEAIPLALVMHVGALMDQRPGRAAVVDWCDHGPHPSDLQHAVDLLLWFIKLLVLVPVYTAMASLRQVATSMLWLLALAPVPVVRQGAQAMLTLMMGTLGQSYALQNSPVRRNAIVRRVVQNLDWLSDRCAHVAIVAHSQGAEVTRLALQMRRRGQVKRWVTLGAGIRPLAALERDHPLHGIHHAKLRWLLLPSSVLLVSTGALALLSNLAGLPPQWAVILAAGCMQAAAAGLLTVVGTAALVAGLAATRLFNVLQEFRSRLSILAVWRDYFASNDPVPGGSMLRDLAADLKRKYEVDKTLLDRPREHQVHNHRFGLLDHTTYFANLEQFVAPLGLDLLQLAGLQGDAQATASALAAADARRAAYTWTHHVVRSAALLALMVMLLPPVALRLVGDLFEPARQAWAVAMVMTGWWDTLKMLWSGGQVERLLAEGWPLLLPPVAWAASAFVMRLRERASGRRLLDDLAAALCKQPAGTAQGTEQPQR